MYLCYLDESGTSEIPGNTSHYVLSGLSIPVHKWKYCDNRISNLKNKWTLSGCELHTAWMRRPYIEQVKIPDFEKMDYQGRRVAVNSYRKNELLRLQKVNPKLYKQVKKNYRKTDPYIHLTYQEREDILLELSAEIGKWDFARLFAECIDKIYFDPLLSSQTPDEQAFEQVVSRFEQYLQITSNENKNLGLIIHDNNQTVAMRLTELMIEFHKKGTLWTKLKNIIETPLFVDSKLTSMVQIADLCSYSLRRYLENGETEIFYSIFKRADRKGKKVVGIRHFSSNDCKCEICKAH